MRAAALLFIAAMLSLPVATSVQAQTFTYQGRLDTAGVPVATPHDFEFRVFSTSSGNTQVGTTTTVLDVTPVDGVFTATVAPGANAFTGADRWLEVAVRPAGSPAFTTLTPRQRIAATPYAARSLSERLTDIGGGVLTNDGSTVNRLILNRTTPITGADYFTLRTPTGQEQFGGMYVDTAAGDGYPFYGFATGGAVRAFAYVEGPTGLFKLSMGGDRVAITNTGLVGIGITPTGPERLQVNGAIRATAPVTAADFAYNTAAARTLSVPPEALRSADGSQFLNFDLATGRAFFDGAVAVGYMIAPLDLPNNATITGFDATLRSALGMNSIQGLLIRRPVSGVGPSIVVANLATTGQVLTPTIIDAAPFAPNLVNTTQFNYSVRFQCADWDGLNNNVYGFRVRYTVPAPD